MSKVDEVESSLSERPEHHRPRRLADWLNLTGARKAHSLIDKVYKRKNLQIAWERVKANQGAGGVDGESIEAFAERVDERLEQLHAELRTNQYRPQPVRQRAIPKADKPGEERLLGIPTVRADYPGIQRVFGMGRGSSPLPSLKRAAVSRS